MTNNTPILEVLPDSLHSRVEKQAQLRPHNIALSYGDAQLTYQQLNALANRQAEKFKALGVCDGDLIALMLPRGLEIIVQVLAVLKAGAGYVPIDPKYPLERVEWILQSSNPVRLVTEHAIFHGMWQEQTPPNELLERIIWANTDFAPSESTVSSNTDPKYTLKKTKLKREPMTDNHNESPAYIIFTSGSTGKPKGVMVGHDQVLSLLDAALPPLNCDHQDVWSLFHSLAFDFSVWELWGALTTGAQLCIVPQDVCWSPEAFADLLRKENVSVLNQTPSAFYALTEAEAKAHSQGAEPLALRSIIFGGEALNLHQLTQWWDRYPPRKTRLINMYGITETTVHVTWLELTPDMLTLEGSPIGKALDGLEVHLLDHALNPVQEGEVGEIYVSGKQLAQGYLGRADLTASRFIASPFHDGQRLYRSGDLAQSIEGQLFYFGRADRQLKIRGFRVEPGEIEAEIETHSHIQRCAVLAQPTPEGHPVDGLLAFLVANTDAEVLPPDAAALRHYLTHRLPVHCLPSDYIFVSSLPLTVNGKLDQSALIEQWRLSQKKNAEPQQHQQQRLDLLRARLAKARTERPTPSAINIQNKEPIQ